MKKCIRIFIVSAILCVMMVGLSGCRQFEQMRQNQAIMTEEGILIVQDEEYRQLPECEYLNPGYSYTNNVIYLAPEGTPVLLSSYFGSELERSRDGKFISGEVGNAVSYSYDNKYLYDEYTHVVYCRSDVYDSVMEVIENGYEPDGYKCEYYDWDEDDMVDYVLSDEETKALDTVLNSAPCELDDDEWWYGTSISSCMKGTVFSQYEFDIIHVGEGYYIERYDTEMEESLYYKAPVELKSIFERICDIENILQIDEYE